MFFIFGISNDERKLNFIQTMVCPRCGQFGRFEVYMAYMYFSLFFIPVFHWGRRYFVKSSCCNTRYEIDIELGKRILRGDKVILKEADLHIINDTGFTSQSSCSFCGYPLSREFDYCPKCGRKL